MEFHVALFLFLVILKGFVLASYKNIRCSIILWRLFSSRGVGNLNEPPFTKLSPKECMGQFEDGYIHLNGLQICRLDSFYYKGRRMMF
jgi:hypothetical protein